METCQYHNTFYTLICLINSNFIYFYTRINRTTIESILVIGVKFIIKGRGGERETISLMFMLRLDVC